MISRTLTEELLQLLQEYPVVTLLGPRQAGKTTLATTALPDYEYINLENPEVREFARDDPKAFLARCADKVILDEIQRVPELLSYIQVIVDQQQRNGQFVLTGSHQLQLHEAISQSLAGRISILNLLPLSISELAGSNISFKNFEDYIFNGFYPRIYHQKHQPFQAYGNYYRTYVERDVRQLINLKDLSLFEKFIKLLAGRVGQLMDYRSLSNDVGVDSKTIKHWLSILEASYIVFKLPPYFENFGKRVIKSPKYYFIDTGLLAWLLGIEKPQQIVRDPLVGQMFENLVVMECLKTLCNHGKPANLYFYRDSNGNEADIIWQRGRELVPMEIKSSSTYKSTLLKSLRKIQALSQQMSNACLIYSGEAITFSDEIIAIRYDEIEEMMVESN